MNKHKPFDVSSKKNQPTAPSARIEVRPDGIIYVEPLGHMTGPAVETLLQDLRMEVARQRHQGKRVRILSNIGSITGHNSEARSAIKAATSLDFDKGAAYGGNRALGMVMQYLQRSIDPERSRYFHSEQQALDYLQASSAPIVAQRERSNVRLAAMSIVGVVILLLVVGAGWRYAQEHVASESQVIFSQQAQRMQSDLQKRMDVYVQALYGFRGLFNASVDVQRNEFDAYFTSLNLATAFPGVNTISYIEHVPATEAGRYVATVRADTSLKASGYPTFQIKPAGERESYDVVTYVEPTENTTLGFDIATDASRRSVLSAARDSTLPTATGSIKLLGQQNSQGFLVTIPIYRGGTPLTVEKRRQQLTGYVNAVFNYDTFFADAFPAAQASGIAVSVRDSDGKIVYSNSKPVSHSQTIEAVTSVGGRQLNLSLSAVQGYGLTATTQALPLTILIGGFIISLLLGIVAITLLRSRREAITLADAMTADLEHERNVAIDNQAKLVRSEAALAAEKASVERKVIARTQELNEARAQLEASLNGLPFGYLILDAHEHTVFANGALQRVLHPTGHNHQSTTLADVTKHLRGVVDVPASLATAAVSRQVVSTDCLLGTSYLTLLFIPIIAGKAQQTDTLNPPPIIGSVVIIEDVTEEKAMQRSRDEFFSIASHELRTPLTVIRGNATMMLEQYAKQLEEPVLHQMVVDVHDAGLRLISIVNDFLDMSRLEQGNAPVNLTEIDLTMAAANAASAFAGEVASQGISLRILPTTKHIRAVTDGARVEQILSSLVSNAVRFTKTGSVSIALDSNKTTAYIRVTDTGSGIPEAAQHLLFRKFQQASTDTLTRESSQSTGLKLYISCLVAQLLGGKLYLERSQVGKGSTFTLELPIHR